MKKASVYVKLPKAGLGNMLLTWSRGYVFSKLNNLNLHKSYWAGIRVGTWLRREKRKRLYVGYFKEDGLIKKINLLGDLLNKKKIHEPPLIRVEDLTGDTIFIFNEIFTDYDFFKDLRAHKELIRNGLFEMLTSELKKRFYRYEKPVIGVHVRRGDFKIGCTITPLSFFIEVINNIRNQMKEEVPVTVFTDANLGEIAPLLDLKQVKLAETKPDILDILLLADSKILVLSIGSTFSYWGGFLSEGIIIKHPNDWHVPFRAESDSNSYKEIFWNDEESLNFKDLISDINKKSIENTDEKLY